MMKKVSLLTLATLFAFAACSDSDSVVEPQATLSLSAAAAEHQAIVVFWSGEVWVLNGEGGATMTYCDPHTTDVFTQSANGRWILTCTGGGVPNNTGRTLHYDAFHNPHYPDVFPDGARCWGFDPAGELVSTLDWKMTLSPSGRFNFMCRGRD